MSVEEAAILLTNLAKRGEATDCEREALSMAVRALKIAKEKKAMA